MNTYFVDLLAWGLEAKVQAAFRQVRRQIADESTALIHVSKSHLASVGLDQIPGLPQNAVGRVLPLVIDARGLSPFINGLWVDAFIRQGGVMALVTMNLASPSPAVGWINRGGTVLRQAWDIPETDMPSLDDDGIVRLEGRKGADSLGEKLMRQFLGLPQVQAHVAVGQEATAA